MKRSQSTLVSNHTSRDGRGRGGGDRLTLAVVWSRSEPDRVGEVLWWPNTDRVGVFGRDPGPPRAGRAVLVRMRPGGPQHTPPMVNNRLSREQIALETTGDRLTVTGIGQRALLHRGQVVPQAVLAPGGLVELSRELLLLCVPLTEPPPTEEALHDFGAPDEDGIVGESPAAWALRQQIRFVAHRREHVLIRGESGTGKELVAAALHRRSGRRALVSRNAATIPEGLIDAELFGNIRSYPNPGMPERQGLIGAAHGGSLFLDELAELAEATQAHLLRVLDAGEYQRLGESTVRSADFRLIAATNRPLDRLKHDLLARLPVRLTAPPLTERRADIPLLVRHFLRGIAEKDPGIARRFFPGADPQAPPRVTLRLMRQLIDHPYTTHARQLRLLLWQSMMASDGDALEALAEEDSAPVDPAAWAGVPPADLPAAVIQAALDECNGVQEEAWKLLGLSSRYQLKRLIQRHGLTVSRRK